MRRSKSRPVIFQGETIPAGTVREETIALYMRMSTFPDQAKRNAKIVRDLVEMVHQRKASEIHQLLIQEFLTSCQQQRELSPKTVVSLKAGLSAFFEFLIDIGHIQRNPCERVKTPKVDQAPPVVLSEEECFKAIKVARAIGMGCEVVLALNTGMRIGEIARLRWEDVDQPSRVLLVRKSKNGKPRVIPLSHGALDALEAQHRKTGKYEYVFPGHTKGNGYVTIDAPRSLNWYMRHLKPIQDAIPSLKALKPGSTSRGFHAFRHTFCTRAAEADMNAHKLQSYMGHSTPSQTWKYLKLAHRYDVTIEKISITMPGPKHARTRPAPQHGRPKNIAPRCKQSPPRRGEAGRARANRPGRSVSRSASHGQAR